jgi:hypothetical protein
LFEVFFYRLRRVPSHAPLGRWTHGARMGKPIS